MTKDFSRRRQHKSGISIHLSLPLILFILVIGFWLVSFAYNPPPLFLSDTYRALSSYPYSPSLHVELAKKLQNTDQTSRVEKEISMSVNNKAPYLLSNMTGENNVLGIQSSIAEMTEKTKESQTQILYWESIVSKYPNFRDAYVQLAILTFNTGSVQKSIRYIQKVLEIDPNYLLPQELIKVNF